MTVRHVVGLSLQKSWSCCWSVLGGIIRKKNWSCGWFCVFVGHTDWKIARFGNFVGHRSENDREKASVGRVVGSEFDRSEQKKGRIRREKLVVRFDSFYVTDENTNYLSAVKSP